MLGTHVGEVTLLLRELQSGNESAKNKLIEIVYPEMRRLARRCLAQERRGHTLQATALVNEVCLRLVGDTEQTLHDRAHLFAIAAILMRRILVDHARTNKAAKRGGGVPGVELAASLPANASDPDMILDIDRALQQLEKLDARQARIVEMRCFAGLTEDEIGDVLQISSRTVKRDWAMAKAWLNGFLNGKSA